MPYRSAELNPETAARWQERWDRQQEGYVTERDRRFGVVADVVTWSATRAGVDAPVVVDLGCGPGSLTRRIAAEVPGAEVVGVDADPLLLALADVSDVPSLTSTDRIATSSRGDTPRSTPRYVRADLTDPGWTSGLPTRWQAAVSSTALHWLATDDLAELYRTVATHLSPGGVFVDSDHRRPAGPAGAELASYLSGAAVRRDGRGDREDWASWWAGVAADPELGALHDSGAEHHHGSNGLAIEEQTRMLVAAGFAEVTTAWAHGDDHVLVGIR